MADLFAASSAVISPCGQYRYRLEREGPGEGRTVVIMVNPSTADAEQDDATIRKLKGFGARNGWGQIIVGNLFAYRATDVRELASAEDAIGPDNDHYLRAMMMRAERLIFAWGPVSKVPPRLRERWRTVLQRTPHWLVPHSIGEPAKCGHPKHPLMLAYDTPIVPWTPPAIAAGSREGHDSEAWRGAKQARAARSASPPENPTYPLYDALAEDDDILDETAPSNSQDKS